MKRTKKAKHKPYSLRKQMTFIILMCWLVPMAFLALVLGGYLTFGLGHQIYRSVGEQLQLRLEMGADRVNSAVEASRLPSYDPELRSAWNQYQADGDYIELYQSTMTILSRLYQADSRFRYAVFSFSADPENMSLMVVSGSSGLVSGKQVREQWQSDLPAVLDVARDLGTAVCFWKENEQIYLVRNLLNSDYQPIGVLALALNHSYYFDDLSLLTWASNVSVELGEDTLLTIKGEEPVLTGTNLMERTVTERDFSLRGYAVVDVGSIMAGFQAYPWLLLAMFLSLLLLLRVTFQFFRKRITDPMEILISGSLDIWEGKYGGQIDCPAESKELEYLIDSFNQMSSQLQHQFECIYQEELARRDAQFKALQAHINPHFLNNTLESINWQARMNGDMEVSRMIEALSTVLDAALDRKGNPEVRLSEEMTYVNAYLYIITQRFGDRLSIEIDLPEELMCCMVPRLILQPVIENAVEHSAGANGRGKITLRGRRQEDRLILEIENDGGLPPEDAQLIERLLSPDYDMSQENIGHIGIANVNQRLRILYGPDCGLSIRAGEGKLVTARLTVALPEKAA